MKQPPYTTSAGVKIGSRYEPPRINQMSREDEFWQSVLLGEHPYVIVRRAIGFGLAVAAFALMLFVVVYSRG